MTQTSAMAANEVYFNSSYNLTSFLEGLGSVFKHIPRDQLSLFGLSDARAAVKEKATVLSYPVAIPSSSQRHTSKDGPLHILWNHRWEWDKGPTSFFAALRSLRDRDISFSVSVVGETGATADKVYSS